MCLCVSERSNSFFRSLLQLWLFVSLPLNSRQCWSPTATIEPASVSFRFNPQFLWISRSSPQFHLDFSVFAPIAPLLVIQLLGGTRSYSEGKKKLIIRWVILLCILVPVSSIGFGWFWFFIHSFIPIFVLFWVWNCLWLFYMRLI